jgi:hypothetical protein
MNRQQRRAAKAIAAQGQRPGGGAGPEDAGYLYEHIFVDQVKMLGLMHAAAGEDARALMIAHAAVKVVEATLSAARTAAPRLCMSCPKELTDARFSIVLAVPKWHAPDRITGGAVCWGCAVTEDIALERAAVAFRKVCPDLRPFGVAPTL